jgi:uroporphyrinogen-III synthase
MGPDEARAWYVISLRPQGGHGALRLAAARAGAGVFALSPWKLTGRDDAATRDQLGHALQSDVVLFTSPAAVRFATRLKPLIPQQHQAWIATGSGTRKALQRAGIADAIAPTRMDSEGLLALPALADLNARSVGLVTAPDGRGMLAPALQARGAQLQLAEIYDRQPLPIGPATLQRLQALPDAACVALSSAGALQHVLQQLPATAKGRLLALPAVAASARLLEAAMQAGFTHVIQAEGPRPAQLIAAANAWFSHPVR